MDRDSHVVITDHGIRTFGGWQRRLERLAGARKPGIGFVHFQYGYFSIAAFIFPFTRWLVVRRFRRELLSIDKRNPAARIDLVGHSFGTHLIAWALRGLGANESLSIHTIILAGSVLRSNFYWPDLIPSRVSRVINDCGANDTVLLASQFLVLFTGMAGRTGFIGMNGPEFVNRFSRFGHSGYFGDGVGKVDDIYMLAHWVPLICEDGPAPAFDERSTPSPWRGLIIWLTNNFEPIKIAVWLSGPIFALLWVTALYVEATAAKERMAAVADLGQIIRDAHGLPRDEDDLLSALQQALNIPLQKTYILWVDGHPSNNVQEREALTRYGFCFYLATSTAEALQIWEKVREKPVLFISNFRRDDDPRAGYALLEDMHAKHIDVPLIYYVLNFTPKQAEDAREHGAQAEVRGAINLFSEVFRAIDPYGAQPTRRQLIMQHFLGC
jgi:hypothetical protein